jgi:hypothetical protein
MAGNRVTCIYKLQIRPPSCLSWTQKRILLCNANCRAVRKFGVLALERLFFRLVIYAAAFFV